MRSAVLLIVVTALVSCKLSPDKDEVNFSKAVSYRCGIFFSHIYEKDIKEEVYPDLGLLLANKTTVGLSAAQVRLLEKRARQCTHQCNLQKEAIYLKQKALQKHIKQNKIKGDLQRVSARLNEIANDKRAWLASHKKRYLSAIETLDPMALSQWLVIEQMVRPFSE